MMELDKQQLVHLVCPQTGGSLHWMEDHAELWCVPSGLAYPVRDGIPVMLIAEARCLSESEVALLKERK